MDKKDAVFIREFYRKVGKAVFDYNLIEEDDKILIGVSGGKDSLSLLEVLASRIRASKEHYSVVAAHISVENVAYAVDKSYIESFCKRLNVPLVQRSIDPSVRDGSGKPACFVCSWKRRKMLFEIAKENGCNKLALGHHRDDAVESLMMSMMFNGTIASMPPKLAMFDNQFTLIRPLIYLSNNETLKFAEIHDYQKQQKNCPYEKATNRDTVHRLLDDMEQISPNVRNNIFAAMKNIRKEYLP